jgi:cyclopropane fatty-acyl-phospholipid synthase-like methyltransferase
MFSLTRFLRNNGERPPLFKTFEQIPAVLQFAYHHVSPLVSDKTILDYGCGGGYGTEYLSRFTNKNVIGFDIDTYATRSAAIFFKNHKNLKFTDIFPANKFDIIVSLQVIEHLDPPALKIYLSRLKSALSPNGHLFISTVNKYITSYQLKKPTMSHHVYEFTPGELKDLLLSHFSQVTMFGQIDNATKAGVQNKTFSYDKKNIIPLKYQLIRPLTQINFVRKIAAITPQIIKDIILFQTNPKPLTYSLVKSTPLINNSYILLCECRP